MSALYVPCIVENDVAEYYFKIDDVKKTFSKSHVIINGKKAKISKRGIPQSLIDIFSENGCYKFVLCESE